MADSLDILRQRLLTDYDELKTQLTRRLGSKDHAEDALQDAWLRLDGVSAVGVVNRPFSYLLRIAYNLGLKRRSREHACQTVTIEDAREALSLVDEAPGPADVAEARSELAALDRVLAELTPRRREILLASRADGIPLREIADRLGISQRLVEMELKMALIHCGRRLDRKIVQRFGPRPFSGSDD